MAAVPVLPIEFPRTLFKKRFPGTGSVCRKNGGFNWRIMRKRAIYCGPTVATRAEAEAGLDEALAAFDRGEKPTVAPPRAEGSPRSKTVTPAQFRRELQATELVEYPPHIKRPQERADCIPCPTCQEWRDNGASSEAGRLACGHAAAEAVAHSRPCLFVACTATNYLDENESGSIKFNHPTLEPGDVVKDSCSLDVAGEGGVTLERAGAALGVTRERIRQTEEYLLVKIRRHGDAGLGVPLTRQEYASSRRPAPGCP